MHRNYTVLLFILPFSLFAQPSAQTDQFFQQLIQKHEVPALSAVIVEGNEITYSCAHGIKATDSNDPIDQNTIFEAASLSKPLFAYAVMQLVDAGKLDLDKPLYQYLRYEDIAHDERYKKITARMLLSHSGGFPNWRRGKLELLFDPGEKYSYSGEGFVYLMKVVENMLEKPIEDIMQEMVFQPLGMNNSSYVWQEAFYDNYAAPHNNEGFALPKNKPQQGNTAYSLHTTAEDFGRFLIAFLNAQNLKPATFKEIYSPQINIEKHEQLAWGLGWGLQETAKGTAVWQWGDNGTFRAFVIAYPEQKKGMVYFTNSNNGLRFVPEVIQHVFQDEECPAFALMDYNTKDSPRQQLLKAILEKGYDNGVKPFLHSNQEHQDTSQIKEWEMNQVGYQLMNYRRYADAKKVLLANIKAFPQSANTYDSYAEACLRSGDQVSAKKYYAKAHARNANNEVAKKILHQLDQPTGNHVFRLSSYPHAKLVTVAGTFNDWNTLSLPFVKRNGEWVCRVDLEPGQYEYKFVIDGVWTIDPNNTEVVVNGGNVNAVLVVE